MSRRALSDAVLTEAAEWFAALQEEPVRDAVRAEWQRWLTRDEAHRQAWARVEALDRRFHALPATPAHHALSAAGRSRRRFLKGGGALAVAAGTGAVAWQVLPVAAWRADLRTAVGEIRETTLPDGTRLWLNTDSAVNLDYDTAHRRLDLLAGEILLETAADPRPLTVHTPAGTAQPLGTLFTVRLEGNHTRVGVRQGRVALYPDQSRDQSAIVEAGHQQTFNSRRVFDVAPLARGSGWERGILIADNRPLGDLLDELARYRVGVIRCDPAVADMEVVGSFPLADTDRVLRGLEATLPITVTRVTPWWVRVAARD
ncbi:Fe2+-dicitrate sensor, membrane component [Alloalcanivorax xenomutans]|jgi:transmembrane sensor|uniref:FecR domain-containing protein n=2 Tax=Alloalcanivorax xenomutans TaxID=1094342 RepID=UPI0006D5B7CE|nr:FecR domain-containing protein [Alloalcanivorax xenomutans]CUR45387.1 Fe2+-dicitrate sensor, membrane component [Alloalcanivorax xenomutans]